MDNVGKLNITKPFGPAIGVTNMPKTLIDKINNFVDEIIKDKNKSKKFDAGKALAGQVSQEILLPREIIEGELLKFLGSVSATYVENQTEKKVTKFDIIRVWIVRQFQNEYNPIHMHGGHISGAGYLKLPDDFGSSIQPEKQVNVNGKINFVYGTRQFLSNSMISQKPEVGKMFIFPNYLMHSVYPFYGKGERRSISFNATIDENIYDVYSAR